MACLTHFSRIRYIQIKTQTDNTANDQTTIAETTTIEDKLSEQTTALEEIELSLFTSLEDTTALEEKKESGRFFRNNGRLLYLVLIKQIFLHVQPFFQKSDSKSSKLQCF